MRPSGTFSARMSRPIPAFKLNLPAHEWSGCARDPNRLNSAPAILNSVADKKSVFVKLEVCKVPVIAVCDTGASMSCISQQLFGQLPVTSSTELQTAHRRLLAANLGKIPVLGTVTLSISLASNRYQQQFFVWKTSLCRLFIFTTSVWKCCLSLCSQPLASNGSSSYECFRCRWTRPWKHGTQCCLQSPLYLQSLQW